jgi:predicted methyltransferase
VFVRVKARKAVYKVPNRIRVCAEKVWAVFVDMNPAGMLEVRDVSSNLGSSLEDHDALARVVEDACDSASGKSGADDYVIEMSWHGG